jgi:hypothetical protein
MYSFGEATLVGCGGRSPPVDELRLGVCFERFVDELPGQVAPLIEVERMVLGQGL